MVRQFGPVARVELSRTLALSPATVSVATAAMVARGVLVEVEEQETHARAGRGRPPVRLDFAPDAGTAASLRVGFDYAEFGLADARGRFVATRARALELHTLDADGVIAMLGDFLAEGLAACGLARPDALAVAFQGFIDAARGVVVWSPVLGCRDVRLAEGLSARFGIPVAIENDAGALALSVARREAAFASGRTAVILLGDGVGLGLLFDGRLYRGARAGGSEYGHIRVGAHGPQCRCGARGCIEASVADYALYRDVRIALGSAAVTGDDEAQKTALVGAAMAGDMRALAVFDSAARVLAEGVSIVLQLLQPENVVIAGPGARARALLEPELRRHLAAVATPGIAEQTGITFVPFETVQFLEGALRQGLEFLDDALAARQD
ncbi:MAG: ROK family protein [Azospirillum sp.]|nr:ROK family protein [Azospirillum sp.]